MLLGYVCIPPFSQLVESIDRSLEWMLLGQVCIPPFSQLTKLIDMSLEWMLFGHISQQGSWSRHSSFQSID